MPKRAALIGLAAVLCQPFSATAADDGLRVLAPRSSWTLDFADERCSLIREFADGDDAIRLQIDSYGPDLGYQVMISGDLVAGSDAAPLTEFRVGYSPDAAERETMGMIVGKFGDENAVSFGPGFLPDGSRAEAARLEFERNTTHMTVAFRGRKPFRLDTGSMAAPLAGMRQCVDDLVASWGIDPAVQRGMTRPPQLVELPEGYTRVKVDLEDDRPGYTERRYQAIATAQARQRTGAVPQAGYVMPVRVMIDAAGQPTACVAQVATASERYRQSVCETFAGPYQPALDAEGRPVASFVQVGTSTSVVQVAAN
jgi:hypothetical protein